MLNIKAILKFWSGDFEKKKGRGRRSSCLPIFVNLNGTRTFNFRLNEPSLNILGLTGSRIFDFWKSGDFLKIRQNFLRLVTFDG